MPGSDKYSKKIVKARDRAVIGWVAQRGPCDSSMRCGSQSDRYGVGTTSAGRRDKCKGPEAGAAGSANELEGQQGQGG